MKLIKSLFLILILTFPGCGFFLAADVTNRTMKIAEEEHKMRIRYLEEGLEKYHEASISPTSSMLNIIADNQAFLKLGNGRLLSVTIKDSKLDFNDIGEW